MSRRHPSSHPNPTHDLLEAIAEAPDVSQRSLAKQIGIALGLTNLLVKRFVGKGWVRVTHVKPHRVRYLLTPAGLAEKARLSQQAFHNSVQRYRVARTRIHDGFVRLAAEWPAEAGSRRVVFYGTGEIAEIGYICLQETTFELVAAIDDCGRDRFFGVPLITPGTPRRRWPAVARDAHVVVMGLHASAAHRAEVERVVDGATVLWI